MLRLSNIHAGYGSGEVLHGVSLSVPKGLVAVLGRNGAGKTTLLETIMGFIRPSSGTVVFDGEDVTGLPPERIARRGVAYVPQEQPVFPRLTVAENLALAHSLGRGRVQPLTDVYELFPVLRERGDQVAASLSGGERKFLALARALIASPDLLILDEPTEGMWPTVIRAIGGLIEELKQELSVLLVEQNVEATLEHADYVYVLERGAILLEGEPSGIKNDGRLERALVV
jgi:branched-chain amino acid transport system ATP-binding protein